MKLTEALKAHVVEIKGIPADSEDDIFRSAAAEALVDGSLTPEKLAELTKDPDAEQASEFKQVMDAMLAEQKSLKEQLAELKQTKAQPAKDAPKVDGDKLDKAFRAQDDEQTDPEKDAGSVRVKAAAESYNKTKDIARYPSEVKSQYRGFVKHPKAGQPIMSGTVGATAPGSTSARPMQEQSELDKAISGAYLKSVMLSQLPASVRGERKLSDHERDLLHYAVENEKWGGVMGGDCDKQDGAYGVKERTLTPAEQSRVKALIDDNTSGGLELAPIAFDDAVILTPLLNGEFFPHVNLVNVTRGRRMEGASIGNVTLSATGGDGTAIPLFNTASFVSAFDTTIFHVNGSVEVGLDFLSDTPINVEQVITQTYGQQLLTWLDTQICVGDGTTEPEGVMNASGTTSVTADNANTGPPTVGDYESLLFGVPRAYSKQAGNMMYAGTLTSYQRARGIAVGASDERRVFGMDHESYMILGHQYGINEGLANTQLFFGNMARYRMYRRLGATLKATTEGKELTRGNLMLIAFRARFGGQIEDGSAFAVTTNAQT